MVNSSELLCLYLEKQGRKLPKAPSLNDSREAVPQSSSVQINALTNGLR